MRASPLKIDGVHYPVVSVRANPTGADHSEADALVPEIIASVGFNVNGEHFAIINVEQADGTKIYTFEIEAFTTFAIDTDACRECYSKGWSPPMLAVNAARLLYSGVRECLATITSRAPHGIATLPSTTLGPEDVRVHFEPAEQQDEILRKFFDYDDERLSKLKQRMKAAKAIAKKIQSDSGPEAGAKATSKPGKVRRRLMTK